MRGVLLALAHLVAARPLGQPKASVVPFSQSSAEFAQARRALTGSDVADKGRRLARLEVARATAEVALGRSSDAVHSMGRALAADPDLELDGASSPKLLRAFDEARSRR